MPRKLTIIGVLAALVLGIVGLTQSASASPTALTDAQSFCTVGHNPAGTCPAGFFPIDWDICYDTGGGVAPSTLLGASPPAASSCGAGTSDTTIPAGLGGGSPIKSWQIISLPMGNRLTLPVTYTPGCVPAAVSCAGAFGTATGIAEDLTVKTGDVTARVEILCNGTLDILARNGTTTGKDPDVNPPPPGGVGGWPDGWDPYFFYRDALSDPNYAYIPLIQPMPATFTSNSIDVARLVTIWLFGSVAFQIAPGLAEGVTDPNLQGTPLVLLDTTSSYVAGLHASVSILAGNPNPPSNSYICLDSPQDSVGTNYLTLPPQAVGDYYRWTNLQSAADLVSGQVTRLMIARCLHVGTGPCTGTGLGDTDGDGVPNAIEAINGTNAAVTDTDGDGATDFDENFQFSNPLIVDTDGDGSWDKQDDLSGFACGANGGEAVSGACTVSNNGDLPATGAGSDDNCPVDLNTDQLNSDSLMDWTNTPNTPAGAIYRGDSTNPHQDHSGDACDSDDDNDGLNDVVEAGFNHTNIAPGCTGAGTSVGGADATCTAAGPAPATLWCLAQGAATPAGGMTTQSTDPLNPDSDSDGGLDGRECQFGSDPKSAATGSCSSTTPTQKPTCVGLGRFPAATATTADGDGDLLYPDGVELFYRTSHINQGTGAALDDLEQGPSMVNTYNCPPAQPSCTPIPDGLVGPNDPDSDGDILLDGVEVKWYGTAPSNFDTDTDGCSDGREAADVNGDHHVNSVDSLAIGQHSTTGSLKPVPPYNDGTGTIRSQLANYDVNKDGLINSVDQLIAGKLTGNCKFQNGFDFAQTAKPIVIGTKP